MGSGLESTLFSRSDPTGRAAAAWQHQAGSALAIALDVDAWSGARPGPGATKVLGQHGWRSVTLGPRDRLDATWQEVGNSCALTSRGVGPAASEAFG